MANIKENISNENIVLLGCGGHASSVADSIRQGGKYSIIGYTAPFENGLFNGIKHLGNDENLRNIKLSGCENAFIAVGYMGKENIRDNLFALIKSLNFRVPYIVDITAAAAIDISIGEGTFIGKNAVVNTDACIGDMCIINSGAIVEHSVTVGDFNHIAVGAVLCGDVTVGDHCLIGAGSVVLQGLHIGSRCIIGAGSTVLTDVPDNTTVYGLWKGKQTS